MATKPTIGDETVGMTRRARKKAERFYRPSEARKRVHDLYGDLWLRHGESDHEEPEMHLHDPDDDWTIVFVVTDEKPVVITQCHNHWDYPADDRFTYIGGGV